ncbi:hypothetical protein HPB48_026382 [Haemaphysalis longicornis]|uniref:Uncharacterized protein n=1 Tax=Haemaphysalis longicornis TaxID=44386 RepID=A0A9J6H101_HAELO|nr:hypothetical protein HPB48_026382 [Haemaphysalis longicornis]
MQESPQAPPTYDPDSGRTLPTYDPWRQILRSRHNQRITPSTTHVPASVSAPRREIQPKLPVNDYEVIIRPRSGLRFEAWPARQLAHSLQQATGIPPSTFYGQVITFPQPQQNLITTSTPSEVCADALRKITTLHLGDTTYDVTAYLKTPRGTSRGVIQGIDPGTPPEQLLAIIYVHRTAHQ